MPCGLSRHDTMWDDFYLKGDQRAWQALLAPPAVDGFTGRWVKLRTEQVTVEIVSIESLAAQLTDNAWLLEPKVEQTALDGRNVVVLSQQNGSRLYVASTGPAYPLRMEDKKPNGWEIGFAEHGTDFHLMVPSNALSNALTAAESAWLDAVKKLSTRMERISRLFPRTSHHPRWPPRGTSFAPAIRSSLESAHPATGSSRSMRW